MQTAMGGGGLSRGVRPEVCSLMQGLGRGPQPLLPSKVESLLLDHAAGEGLEGVQGVLHLPGGRLGGLQVGQICQIHIRHQAVAPSCLGQGALASEGCRQALRQAPGTQISLPADSLAAMPKLRGPNSKLQDASWHRGASSRRVCASSRLLH
jgi:hypothetical protein